MTPSTLAEMQVETSSAQSANTNAQKYPQVLLVTPAPPNTALTGALMLHEMFKNWPKEKLSCYAVMNRELDPAIHEHWRGIDYHSRHKPNESKSRSLPGIAGDLESFLKEEFTSRTSVKKIAQDVVSFARKTGAEKIWCVLEGQTLIRLAKHLQDELTLPMVTQIWDPPTWWMRDCNVDDWSQRKILGTFAEVLSKSEAVATASFAMAEQYRQIYNCNAMPMMPGISEDWLVKPAPQPNKGNKLVLGFAGQLYADDEWTKLLSVLDENNWEIAGRQVVIHVLGRRLQLHRRASANIRFFGWRSQIDSIQILSQCDVLFCPYWFSPVYETEAKLSFPSKLSTYFAAGRPVLFFGPDYAAPGRFIREHRAGVAITTNSEAALLAGLEGLISDENGYTQHAVNGQIALSKHLSDKTMKEQFLRCLGIEKHAGGASCCR